MRMIGQYGVLPCPFCGKEDTIDFSNAKEEGWCKNAENSDSCPAFDSEECNGVYVVCSVLKGGCGAASGFAWGKERAVLNWNMRGGDAE